MRKILVLGATSGIAIPCLKLWAEKGASFFLCARDSAKLNIVGQDLKARGAGEVHEYVCNLSDYACHSELLQQAGEKLADYDTVFLAYGSLGSQEECQQSFDLALKEYQNNFLSAVSLLTPIANDFEAKKRGSINVITSVAGDRGRRVNYIYGSAKGAMSLYLQGLRSRLCPANVHVLTIKPGFVETQMTAHLKKGLLFALPEQIAPKIVKAVEQGKDQIYVPGFWWLIMTVFCAIPERFFKRLAV